MILSDEHRYLFVELPHTGTTAISRELQEHYGGRPILIKHARYHQFRKIATREQKSYFVFSCIRNPAEEAVSCGFDVHVAFCLGQREPTVIADGKSLPRKHAVKDQ